MKVSAQSIVTERADDHTAALIRSSELKEPTIPGGKAIGLHGNNALMATPLWACISSFVNRDRIILALVSYTVGACMHPRDWEIERPRCEAVSV